MFRVSCFVFRVSGFGFRVPLVRAGRALPHPRRCFGFRVNGFGFRISSAGFWVLGFRFQVFPSTRFRVSSVGLRASDFGYRVSGFGFRVSGSGFQVPGFGFRGSGFEIWVPGVGFRVSLGVFERRPVAAELRERRAQVQVRPCRVVHLPRNLKFENSLLLL